MRNGSTQFLAIVALLINATLMLPCACCVGAVKSQAGCCSTHSSQAEQGVESQSSCCGHSCCSVDKKVEQPTTQFAQFSSCHKQGSSEICCCTDSDVVVPTTTNMTATDDLFDSSLFPSLTAWDRIDLKASFPFEDQFFEVLERTVVSSRSPCALLQLFCVWLK